MTTAPPPFRVPVSACPRCGKRCDSATHVSGPTPRSAKPVIERYEETR